uniref:Structure-specific endonuclease subunit SLX4 n=1 Tax=Denticeps clupeoides TaxID=299321 RepID=A0AAY4BAA7_9TELE
MSYFHRTPPSKEKSNSSSPQMGKEILLQSPEDLNNMLRAVSPAELPVSPRTLTVQAEVHPVSPDHNPIGFMEKKMASIFTSNKRDRNKTVATQQGRAENLPTPVRRSNVVLEEDDLELAVLESSSTPRCSVEEVKQFMNAFKQPSQDGAKSKSSKKQKLTKDELEEKKKCSEELIMDQTEPEPPKEDKAAADCRRTRTRKKPAKKSAEQENGAPVMETAGSSAEAPDLPTVREVRRSTRDISRTSRRQESAAQDRPPTTTPKTGRYRAEMLAPPDSKGSPIRSSGPEGERFLSSLVTGWNPSPLPDLLQIMDHRNPRCWDLLAEARRSGLDLLYSNFEVLLPLPTRTLVHSTFSQPAEPRSVTLKPDPALMVDEAGADPSPLKISSRMKQKKQLGFRGKELFQSDSESDEDVLVLPKSQNSAVKGEERQAEVQRVMTPAEKQRSVPVSRCLDSLSGFLDTMSFLDSSLSHEDLQVEGATSWPSAFGWPGPEVKSGLMDEPRLERLRPQPADGRWQEVWAAAESLSFGRCRAELEEAWRRTPTLPEEVRQAAVEDLTLPVAPHRQTFSLTRNVPLPVQRRRRELMSGLCGGWPLSTLGNRAAVVLDYLPALRAVCRAERLKEQGRVKRRFLHYLDGTGLPKKTLQDLAAEF